MMGELVTRVLVLLLGYAYPAYECFKTLESTNVDAQQLYFWCQYWTIVGTVTVLENMGDLFVSWLPLYGESKLAFFVYLWYPKTKGAIYVYESLLRPYILRHQPEIEKKVQQVAAKSGDILMFYTKNFASQGQAACLNALNSVISRSPSLRRNPSKEERNRPPPPPQNRPPPYPHRKPADNPSPYYPPPSAPPYPSRPDDTDEYDPYHAGNQEDGRGSSWWPRRRHR